MKSCIECPRVKHSVTGPKGLMQIKTYQDPWSVVVAYIQGPFPASAKQFKYLLVVVDELTKFVVVEPLGVASGNRIWEVLFQQVFLTFGFP